MAILNREKFLLAEGVVSDGGGFVALPFGVSDKTVGKMINSGEVKLPTPSS